MLKESKCCLVAVSAIATGGLIMSGSLAKAAETGALAKEVSTLKESVRATNTRLQRVEDEVSRLGGKSVSGGTQVSYDKPSRTGGTPAGVQGTRHVVARGDTLSSISRQYQVGLDRLLAANRFDDPHRLRIGQEVIVPGTASSPPARESQTPAPVLAPKSSRSSSAPAGSYVVRGGDTLSSIARTYGTSVSEIMSLNRLSDAHILRIGQQLQVPGATGAPSRKDSPPVPTPSASGNGNGGGGNIGSAPASGEVEAPEGHGWYQVEKGDTLHSISLSFGTTTRELRSLNDMKSDELRIGQYLLVPVSDESLYES